MAETFDANVFISMSVDLHGTLSHQSTLVAIRATSLFEHPHTCPVIVRNSDPSHSSSGNVGVVFVHVLLTHQSLFATRVKTQQSMTLCHINVSVSSSIFFFDPPIRLSSCLLTPFPSSPVSIMREAVIYPSLHSHEVPYMYLCV